MLRIKTPHNFLIYKGRFLRAEWYYTADCSMPAYEYYCGASNDTQNRLDEMIQYFCDRPYGTILPKTMYRIEDPAAKIYAFKPQDKRFFNFTASGGVVVVTNAYHKQSQKMRKINLEQLKIAARYKMDYLERIKRNTYYAY